MRVCETRERDFIFASKLLFHIYHALIPHSFRVHFVFTIPSDEGKSIGQRDLAYRGNPDCSLTIATH